MSPLGEHLLTQSAVRERNYGYRYEKEGATVSATVTGEGERSRMALEWAFGSGVQAYTAVGRAGRRWIEHRISFYAAPARVSLTPGHAGRAILSAEDALGIGQEPSEIARCFGCHATRVRPTPDGVDLAALEPGVQCERCHGPGSEHVEASGGSDPARARKTILNAGRLPASAIVMICGECHRTPKAGQISPAPELEDPLSVRFQPVGLMASRCFQTSGNLSCLTCHDPHGNVRKEEAYYTGKCLSCHDGPRAVLRACRRTQRENCLPCHMRRTTPAPHLSFVDHRIRIYSE